MHRAAATAEVMPWHFLGIPLGGACLLGVLDLGCFHATLTRIIMQRSLEIPMRIRKLFPVLVVGGLLLAAGQFAAAPGLRAQPFGYGQLTPAQKAHVSGLLSVELGGGACEPPRRHEAR
jgi:hypothetical protein